MYKNIFLCFLLFCVGNHLAAQNISNEGTEFWVAYGHHQFMETNAGYTNSQNMVLYLSTKLPAIVKVTLDSSGNASNPVWTRTYNIPANTVISTGTTAPSAGQPLPLTAAPMPKLAPYDSRLFSIDCSFAPPGSECNSEQVFTKRGFHIESNVPIVAYAHIYGSFASGATMLLPVESWGYTYTSINSNQTNADNSFSWMYVIAKNDSTVVEITPSVISRKGKPPGVPFTVTLQKGHIYQLVGQTTGSNGVELTGTKVKSIANPAGICHPIAVFSGSSRTGGFCNGVAGGSRDNDMQQLFPQQSWGKVYLTAPLSNSGSASSFMRNVYKVAVKDPTTIVKRNGVVLTGLILNTYYRFESNTADLIEADKPIMVAQFMGAGSGCVTGQGDPEMIYLSPIEQSIKSVGFYRNTLESITHNYVTGIIPTNGVSTLRIDGVLFSAIPAAEKHSYVHPIKNNYTVFVRRWNPASFTQSTLASDSSFTAVTYGLGSAESYGYNAGTFLNNLNLLGSIRNTNDSTSVKEHNYTCKGSPVQLSALYAYQPQNLVWELSSLGSFISPNVNVTQTNPVATDSVYVNGVKYYKYTLPSNYIFNDTGTFEIPILSTHPSIENCTFSERLKYTIKVKATPLPTFSINNSGCTSDTVRFFGNSTTLNGYQNQQYMWVFPVTDTVRTQNASKLFPPGNHLIKFRTVTDMGCVGDSSTTIVIGNRPGSDFTFLPSTICEGSNVVFTDNSGVSGAGPGYNWYWDFGNGTIVNAATNTNQTINYPTYGTYTVKHVVRSSATCFSDTVSKTVTVYAKPRVNFSFPTNCLVSNGMLQFTNNTTIPDGQSLTSWAWNFNDPNANAGNPNTSALQNPTHNFLDGTYNVNLQATSQQGCIKDTTISVPVKLNPALSFSALNSVCVNASSFSIANASVTNNVNGSGVYSGPGVNAAGMFNPSAAGVGTHTIKYIFTSNNSCVDSITQTIQVKAKPIVNFTYPTGGCLPPNGLAQFNGIANLSDGQTVSSWAWNFNDPNANGGNPNTSALQNPSHNFTANGIYNINLTVNSSGSCVGDTTIALNLNLKPALNYPALNSVCINAGGTINVATATVTNGASGTGSYSGPGTTSAGIFTPTLAGVGTHTIWFKYTTPNGCTDSITQTIQVRAKPIVNFTYPTGGCLPPNGLAQFNGSANLSDGQTVSSWAWNFNDPNANGGNPNTSVLQNPSHNFTANGIYNINLTVNSSGSCVGDTTISLNLNLKPALNYPALLPVCQSLVGSINIATATVTNGASGTGVYSGISTTAAGQFTPSTAGSGTFTIWYKFTTPIGCVDSVSQTITVQPKPTASFNKTDVCLGLNTSFTNTSTIASGSISNWYWDFGDGTTTNNNNGNSLTKTYANAGTYIVKLVVTSNAGCISDTAFQTVIVHPNPVVDFTLPTSVCMPGNAVNIINQSTIAGNGTLSYTWNFGDGNTSNNTNASHIYNAINNYNISLTAVSAFGCSVTNSKPFNAFFVKPIASFTINKDTLCLGQNSTFTNTSIDPNGSAITNWNWSFGDGTNSNVQSPTKIFAAAAQYVVSLTVTNAAGCVSNTFTRSVAVAVQPTIDAGPSFVVSQGSTITFNATGSPAVGVNLIWTPTIFLTNANTLRPTHIATADRTFTLTATSVFGNCTASDFLTVKVLKKVKIPNAFSPNGDGVNDRWEIENLIDYTDCVIQIYNRYGQKLQQITGYSKPWDGTVNGKSLPVATYYYIMDLKNGLDVLKGSVTIIR